MAEPRTPPAPLAVRVDPAAPPGGVIVALARLLRRMRDVGDVPAETERAERGATAHHPPLRKKLPVG